MSSKVLRPGRGCALALAFVLFAHGASADDAVGTGGEPSPAPAAFPPPAPAAPLPPAPAPPPPPTPEDAAVPEIPEIVVVGRRGRGTVERDPTASATVVAADRFAGEAKGVAALAATAPGVAVNEYGGLGHLTTVSIRGASADGVLVLLDGLPLDTALGGGVDLAAIPRAWIERIEIVRGAEGAHYGAGALGGIVNVVTRSAHDRSWALETGAGSFGTYAASAEAGGRVAGGTLLASFGAERTEGDFPYLYDPTPDFPGDAVSTRTRTNDAVRRASGVLKGAWTFGDTRIDAAAQGWAGRRELPGAIYALTPDAWQEDARILLSTRISTPLGRRLVVAARPSLRLDRIDTPAAEQRGTAAGVQAEGRFTHGDALLRATVDAESETLRTAGLGAARTRPTVAAALSEDLSLANGRARLGPAVRAERVGEFSGISAKAGASVRLFGPLAARASVGRTFRAPSFAELYLKQGLVQPNPDLRPEEGLGGDAGLVAEHAIGFAALGVHTTVYRDLIFYQPATHGILKPQNSTRALARGLEAEAALAPIRALAGLSLSGSYTLLETRILKGTEDTIGNELPHRARHRLYARAAIAPEPFEAHVELHLVGRQFADASALRVVPRATTWNAGASVRLARKPSLHLHVEVRNVLDDRNLQDALGNPLPSRTLLLTLRAGPAPTEGIP